MFLFREFIGNIGNLSAIMKLNLKNLWSTGSFELLFQNYFQQRNFDNVQNQFKNELR